MLLWLLVFSKRHTSSLDSPLPGSQPARARQGRRSAAIDFALSVGVVLASIPLASALTPIFRRASGLAAVLALASFQFGAEGMLPLILITLRRERFSDYGFTRCNAGKSIAMALILVAANDLVLSLHTGAWWVVPLRRHTAMRLSLAAGFPLSLVGIATTIAIWGFFEAFFGVFFAKKLNEIVGHGGKGWLAPGALGFALFNGLLHLAIGQGATGFLSSLASGYVIGLIPAVTGNAWGSALFQTATNAVGKL